MLSSSSFAKIPKEMSSKIESNGLEKASTSSKEKKHVEIKNSKHHRTFQYCLQEILFKKNKFQLSNAYDEENSEEFLNHKNHFLKEVILSDKIDKKVSEVDSSHDSFKSVPSSDNKIRYQIIVTNYDEEKANKQGGRSCSANIKKHKKNNILSKFSRHNV